MRTTLSIDDDVLFAVKERARREGRSAGDVLSELGRLALTGQVDPSTGGRPGTNGFHPLPRRGVAISNAFIDRLREEEAE